MATTWEYQNRESGEGWNAGQSNIAAGSDSVDGQVVYAGQLGSGTTWTLQDES